jgi:hypothetical protein
MNHKEHVTETPDTSHIKNIDVTHEMSDVYLGGIAKFVVGLFVLIVVSFVLMWAMFRMLQSQPVEGEKPRSPMARTDQERLPPEPRLQSAPGFAEELEKTMRKENESAGGNSKENTANAPVGKDPLWEIKVLHNQWDEVLKNGPTDASGKRYGMPIDQAKQEVLKQLAAQKAEGTKQ